MGLGSSSVENATKFGDDCGPRYKVANTPTRPSQNSEIPPLGLPSLYTGTGWNFEGLSDMTCGNQPDIQIQEQKKFGLDCLNMVVNFVEIEQGYSWVCEWAYLSSEPKRYLIGSDVTEDDMRFGFGDIRAGSLV
ncbi:hypothetical protein GH714_009972 [Hevea brasiliensis]|uniref:Uncharacterized protein n=1 Tax=Hevea brasiliensis TaxID=3981 RepID=A0A6A6MLP5_HEVBR|nr:hypothetical protein GH714_009972 [Hevea brasiliensis]